MKIRDILFVIIIIIICGVSNSPEPETENEFEYVEQEQIGTPNLVYTYYETTRPLLEQEDIDYLAKCVMAEAGNQDEYGKRLVIDVILNRLDNDNFPNTIQSIIKQPGQFEVVQNEIIEIIVPTNDIYTLIEEELENRTNEEVLYFRTNYYHSFGTPVLVHQDHYFSK